MTNFELIIKLAKKLKKQYPGYKPEEIIQAEGLNLQKIPMGDSPYALKGFLQKNNRCFTITVNSDLKDVVQSLVMLHEIGHFELGHNKGVNSYSLADTTFSYRQDNTMEARMENEANFFVSEYLLDDDKTLDAICESTIQNAARNLRVPLELLILKLRILTYKKKLDMIIDTSYVRSDFLLGYDIDGIIEDN